MTIQQPPLTEKQWDFIKRFCGLPEADVASLTPAVGKRLIDLTTALWDQGKPVPPVRTYYRSHHQKKRK